MLGGQWQLFGGHRRPALSDIGGVDEVRLRGAHVGLQLPKLQVRGVTSSDAAATAAIALNPHPSDEPRCLVIRLNSLATRRAHQNFKVRARLPR
eukprot:7383974-Prymnesium_polylepis.2